MSWTKRQIIDAAFEEIGLASYDYDKSADEWQSALRALDNLMAIWSSSGIVFDPVYPQPASYGGSDADEPTNGPDDANLPMILGLAVRIAPSYGKNLPIDTKMAARTAYGKLLGQAAGPPEMSLAGMPAGAGHKRRNSPFF